MQNGIDSTSSERFNIADFHHTTLDKTSAVPLSNMAMW